MKKLMIPMIALLTMLSAGTLKAQTGFGVKGSFNMVNMLFKDANDKKLETDMIPGFDAGVFAEVKIADEFYLRPELLYTQKGNNYELPLIETKTTVSYIELPVNFLYKGALSNGFVMVGFGPYFAYGIGGTAKTGSVSVDVKFANDYTDASGLAVYYRPFDMGGKVMAGYEMPFGLQVALNASLGMSNNVPKFNGKEPETTVKHMGFGLSLGYKF